MSRRKDLPQFDRHLRQPDKHRRLRLVLQLRLVRLLLRLRRLVRLASTSSSEQALVLFWAVHSSFSLVTDCLATEIPNHRRNRSVAFLHLPGHSLQQPDHPCRAKVIDSSRQKVYLRMPAT